MAKPCDAEEMESRGENTQVSDATPCWYGEAHVEEATRNTFHGRTPRAGQRGVICGYARQCEGVQIVMLGVREGIRG